MTQNRPKSHSRTCEMGHTWTRKTAHIRKREHQYPIKPTLKLDIIGLKQGYNSYVCLSLSLFWSIHMFIRYICQCFKKRGTDIAPLSVCSFFGETENTLYIGTRRRNREYSQYHLYELWIYMGMLDPIRNSATISEWIKISVVMYLQECIKLFSEIWSSFLGIIGPNWCWTVKKKAG